MCNAYNLKTRMAAIGEAARIQLGAALVFPDGQTAETTNMEIPEALFPRRDGLILRPVDVTAPQAGLEPVIAHWNLTPFFHKGGFVSWKASTNNCRSETMATSPAFRDAVKRRRCIVPATSFTEWTGPKGTKTKHTITRADGGLLFLAGLWDRLTVEGEDLPSYTMVMQAAGGGDDMTRFHTRQPVVLDAETARVWLDLDGDVMAAVKAPPPGTLAFDPPEPAYG